MPDGFAVAPARLSDAQPALAAAATRLRESAAQAHGPLAAAGEAAAGQATGPALAELARLLALASRTGAARLERLAGSLARGADGHHDADRGTAQAARVR